jgi:hypothetical protein
LVVEYKKDNIPKFVFGNRGFTSGMHFPGRVLKLSIHGHEEGAA